LLPQNIRQVELMLADAVERLFIARIGQDRRMTLVTNQSDIGGARLI
jgi:hypothetical protein